MIGIELYDIFDPVQLTPWPGREKEVTDEAIDALHKYFRPQHVIERIGEFDVSAISKEAKLLLLRCLARIEINLTAIKKRSKKYANDDKVDMGIVRMVLYQMSIDHSLQTVGLTLHTPYMDLTDEEKKVFVQKVANAIVALPPIIDKLRSKLKGEKS